MNAFRRLVTKVFNPTLNARNLQEDLDTLQVFLSLQARTFDDPDQAFELDELHATPTFQQKQFIADNVSLQALENPENPYPPPMAPEVQSHLESYLDKKMNLEELYKRGAEVTHPQGFKLQIRKSRIDHPESGYGVFVEGHAPLGTVLGIYPGRVYFPSQLSKDVVENNDYLISRFDGFVIDAREWTRRAHAMRRKEEAGSLISQQGKQLDLSTLALRNPFALAHYVNHPPPGSEANVLNYSYNFLNNWPMRQLIPHDNAPRNWAQFEGMTDVLQRSLVMIATRDLDDEELLLNYRYNPAHPYPSWYVQPDLEAAKRRWTKISVFSRL